MVASLSCAELGTAQPQLVVQHYQITSITSGLRPRISHQTQQENLFQKKKLLEMALESLCLYNKFGHCKFSETCRKLHNKEICRNKTCEIQHCLKRHPRPCKYFQEYKRCKFGEFCSFSHDSEYHIHVPNNMKKLMPSRKRTQLPKMSLVKLLRKL